MQKDDSVPKFNLLVYCQKNRRRSIMTSFTQKDGRCLCCSLTLKAPNRNCSRRQFIFFFYFYLSKKIRFDFSCYVAEVSLETSSLIFSEKEWKTIYECRHSLKVLFTKFNVTCTLNEQCLKRLLFRRKHMFTDAIALHPGKGLWWNFRLKRKAAQVCVQSYSPYVRLCKTIIFPREDNI